MSLLFPARSRAPHRPEEPGGEACDRGGAAGVYLTDGVELYRSLGVMSFDPGQMIALENCRSLDFLLMSVEEFHRLQLESIDPADCDPADCGPAD